MTTTKPKFNSSLTFLIAIINTILLISYLFELNDNENQTFYYFIAFWYLSAIQLGFITYFDTSKNKKIYKTLSIIAIIIALIATAGLIYIMGLGAAFSH